MLLELIKIGKTLPTHEDYSSMISKMKFYEASCEVDEHYWDTIDPNGNQVFKKFTCEEMEDAKFRKSISTPRNYIQSILTKYLSTIFQTKPVRIESDFYKNVDLLGSNMDDFMFNKAWEAAVYGASYMLPDSTATDSNLSEAQKRQIGVRPFIRSIPTENVVNWIDYLGHMQEVIVIFDGIDGSKFAMWYDNENMCRIELSESGKVLAINEVMPNGYSFMPLIRMMPINTNESFIASGASMQMTINNLLSLEKSEIFSNTFTRFFLKGVRIDSDNENATKKVVWGNNRLISTDSPDAAITPLGSDVAQAQSIRDSIKGEEEALYKHYHMSMTQIQESSQAPSGRSIELSREDFNNICNLFANTLERGEKQITTLLNETEGLGLADPVYSREFVQPSKQEDIANLRDILALDIDEDMKTMEKEEFRAKYYSDGSNS